MDNAPTSPRESAREERTMLMIKVVVTTRMRKLRANIRRFDNECPKRMSSLAKDDAEERRDTDAQDEFRQAGDHFRIPQ